MYLLVSLFVSVAMWNLWERVCSRKRCVRFLPDVSPLPQGVYPRLYYSETISYLFAAEKDQNASFLAVTRDETLMRTHLRLAALSALFISSLAQAADLIPIEV